MKKTILIFALAVAASAGATRSAFNLFAWEPVVFNFTSDAALVGIDEMKASGDQTLKDMQDALPSFKDRFQRAFAFAGAQVLNMPPLPAITLWIYDGNWTAEERLHSTGAAIAYAVDEVRERILHLLQSHFAHATGAVYEGEGKYLYCEKNPRSTAELCEDDYPYDWAFARRLFTRASFMTAMCPVITEVALWNLNWNAGHEADFAAFFDEMDRVLALYYNNGQWTDQIVGTIHSAIGDRLTRALDRRYMDGGPEYMRAMQNCLKDVRAAYANQKPAHDATATAQIDAILKFQDIKIAATGETVSVNAVQMDRGEVYRLARHFGPDAYRPPTPDAEFGALPETMAYLTMTLTQIDPVYSYRVITAAEHRQLRLQADPIVMAREYVVVASDDYLKTGLEGVTFHFGYSDSDDLEDVYPYEDYPVNYYFIVRVKK